MSTKRKIPANTAQLVLLQSKRRCPICFSMGVTEPQPGSIVPLDPNLPHDMSDNLVFLCADHLAEFDKRESLDAEHVKGARDVLYRSVANESLPSSEFHRAVIDYEDQIADLIRNKLAAQFGDFFMLQRNSLYRGSSGVSHEVDLATEFNVAGFRYLTIFELKYRRNPLGAQDILEFCARSEDIKANKAILVSSSGFSSAAIRIAQNKGITLATADSSTGVLELSEAVEPRAPTKR